MNNPIGHIENGFNCQSIFSKFEEYMMTHDENGKLYSAPKLNRKQKSVKEYHNLHLCEGLRFTEKEGFAILDPYTGPVDFEFVSFADRHQRNGSDKAIHFFIDDYKFSNQLEKRIDKVTMELSKFGAIIAPDYTLYSDVNPIFNKLAIFKRQLYAAYWQQICGFNIVPTAGLPCADAIEYAFEGIPSDSVIGYCGIGHDVSRSSKDLWIGGLYALVENKNPRLLLIYGQEVKLPGINTPVIFIPDHISSRLRTK